MKSPSTALMKSPGEAGTCSTEEARLKSSYKSPQIFKSPSKSLAASLSNVSCDGVAGVSQSPAPAQQGMEVEKPAINTKRCWLMSVVVMAMLVTQLATLIVAGVLSGLIVDQFVGDFVQLPAVDRSVIALSLNEQAQAYGRCLSATTNMASLTHLAEFDQLEVQLRGGRAVKICDLAIGVTAELCNQTGSSRIPQLVMNITELNVIDTTEVQAYLQQLSQSQASTKDLLDNGKKVASIVMWTVWGFSILLFATAAATYSKCTDVVAGIRSAYSPESERSFRLHFASHIKSMFTLTPYLGIMGMVLVVLATVLEAAVQMKAVVNQMILQQGSINFSIPLLHTKQCGQLTLSYQQTIDVVDSAKGSALSTHHFAVLVASFFILAAVNCIFVAFASRALVYIASLPEKPQHLQQSQVLSWQQQARMAKENRIREQREKEKELKNKKSRKKYQVDEMDTYERARLKRAAERS